MYGWLHSVTCSRHDLTHDACIRSTCAIAWDEAHLLDRALANVPEAYREVLVLSYREEQSIAEVARQLASDARFASHRWTSPP